MIVIKRLTGLDAAPKTPGLQLLQKWAVYFWWNQICALIKTASIIQNPVSATERAPSNTTPRIKDTSENVKE